MFLEAMRQVPAAVTVVSVREERDDIGGTVNTFASISLDPPLVLVSLAGYLAEVLLRRDTWAATVLAAGQKAVASRFATPGRPSARLLLAGLPHHRGEASEALIVEGGVAALEAETTQVVPAGDHTVFIARVVRVDYLDETAEPLVRLRGRYRP
ncbi:reductase [Microtetraspora sp. NBRC 13810]|uniref:flavin reductase family protein n=1 Tax=Microtetraspora sp. NBRC 13810 TaxID=3030990 RepID=UPI0024A01C8C|nr:flavin reductase family protein [Microtetraspora sp. NBRC 13810]GLW06188.1 reductase [Microtetraspora sp. NBRC 13810]